MLKTMVGNRHDIESRFFFLFIIVHERERYLTDEAKVVQYSAVLRYFTKFLEPNEMRSTRVLAVLYRVFMRLGDIYCKDGLQNQDNTRYFLAAEYYNQALQFAYKT